METQLRCGYQVISLENLILCMEFVRCLLEIRLQKRPHSVVANMIISQQLQIQTGNNCRGNSHECLEGVLRGIALALLCLQVDIHQDCKGTVLQAVSVIL